MKLSMIATAVVALFALGAPIAARQTASPVPTTKQPLRFSAFAVSMNTGMSGEVEIAIERWSTDAERTSLIGLLGTATQKVGGQNKLLYALQAVKPRVGYIRTPNSIGWDLKYARQNTLAGNVRQIVIASDKPVSFLAATSDSDAMDYPFSFVEMRIQPNDKGEGRLLVSSAIIEKSGQVQLENYGQEPVRLTTITEQDPKKK
jgi:hypothetical protein